MNHVAEEWQGDPYAGQVPEKITANVSVHSSIESNSMAKRGEEFLLLKSLNLAWLAAVLFEDGIFYHY